MTAPDPIDVARMLDQAIQEYSGDVLRPDELAAIARALIADMCAAGLLAVCRCGKPNEASHCSFCHDDPPPGHVCPRCGRAPGTLPMPAQVKS